MAFNRSSRVMVMVAGITAAVTAIANSINRIIGVLLDFGEILIERGVDVLAYCFDVVAGVAPRELAPLHSRMAVAGAPPLAGAYSLSSRCDGRNFRHRFLHG